MIAALLLAVASAQTTVSLPEGPHAVHVVRRADREVLLLQGPDGVTLFDPREGTEETLTLPGFRSALTADWDRDHGMDLLLCTDAGVVRWNWDGAGATEAVFTAPCTDMAFILADRPVLVVISDGRLIRHDLDGRPDAVLDPSLPDDSRLVASGDGLAVLRPDGVDLWGPEGKLVGRESGVDGAARIGDGWVLTRGGVVEASDGLWLPDASLVVGVDMNADGTLEPAVVHRQAEWVGWLDPQTQEEIAHPLTGAPERLLVLDVDGDGGRDLVALHEGGLTWFPVQGAPPDVQRTVPSSLAPAPTRPFLGAGVPLFQGVQGELASGRQPAAGMLLMGGGLALGSAIDANQGIGGSPYGLATLERLRPSLQTFIGLDTAPILLLLQAQGADFLWHLAWLTGGVTFGNPHLRAGPYASAGLIGVGGGSTRGVHTVRDPVWRPRGRRVARGHRIRPRRSAWRTASGRDLLFPGGGAADRGQLGLRSDAETCAHQQSQPAGVAPRHLQAFRDGHRRRGRHQRREQLMGFRGQPCAVRHRRNPRLFDVLRVGWRSQRAVHIGRQRTVVSVPDSPGGW